MSAPTDEVVKAWTILRDDSRLRAEDIAVDARHAAAKSREQMP